MSHVKNDAKKKSAGEMSVSVSFCYVTAAPKLGGLNNTKFVELLILWVGWDGWMTGMIFLVWVGLTGAA